MPSFIKTIRPGVAPYIKNDIIWVGGSREIIQSSTNNLFYALTGFMGQLYWRYLTAGAVSMYKQPYLDSNGNPFFVNSRDLIRPSYSLGGGTSWLPRSGTQCIHYSPVLNKWILSGYIPGDPIRSLPSPYSDYGYATSITNASGWYECATMTGSYVGMGFRSGAAPITVALATSPGTTDDSSSSLFGPWSTLDSEYLGFVPLTATPSDPEVPVLSFASVMDERLDAEHHIDYIGQHRGIFNQYNFASPPEYPDGYGEGMGVLSYFIWRDGQTFLWGFMGNSYFGQPNYRIYITEGWWGWHNWLANYANGYWYKQAAGLPYYPNSAVLEGYYVGTYTRVPPTVLPDPKPYTYSVAIGTRHEGACRILFFNRVIWENELP